MVAVKGKSGIYIRTEEMRKRMSLGQKGKVLTEEHRRKIGENNARYWLGKKRVLSEEHLEKLRQLGRDRKGKSLSDEHKRNIGKSQKGEKGNNWKGDAVGYPGLHSWVVRELGKPSKCEHCGREDAKRYDWANKSHKYRRDVKDWMRLCRKCHVLYDKTVGRYERKPKTVSPVKVNN